MFVVTVVAVVVVVEYVPGNPVSAILSVTRKKKEKMNFQKTADKKNGEEGGLEETERKSVRLRIIDLRPGNVIPVPKMENGMLLPASIEGGNVQHHFGASY